MDRLLYGAMFSLSGMCVFLSIFAVCKSRLRQRIASTTRDPIASIFVVDSPHAAESLPNTHPPKTPSFLHQFPAFSLQTTSIVPGYIHLPEQPPPTYAQSVQRDHQAQHI